MSLSMNLLSEPLARYHSSATLSRSLMWRDLSGTEKYRLFKVGQVGGAAYRPNRPQKKVQATIRLLSLRFTFVSSEDTFVVGTTALRMRPAGPPFKLRHTTFAQAQLMFSINRSKVMWRPRQGPGSKVTHFRVERVSVT